MFRLFYLIHELAVLEPESQIRGVVVIMDYKDLGMKQVRALSPSFSLLLLSFIQDAMPLRLKEVHMVQQPFIFNMVWSLFKPFIRPKLKSRVNIKIIENECNILIKTFIYYRFSSMVLKWNHCINICILLTCQQIMVENYQQLITLEQIGILLCKKIWNILRLGTVLEK